MSRLSEIINGTIVAWLCVGWPCVAMAQIDARAPKRPINDAIVVTLQAAAIVDQPIATVGAVATIQGGEPWLRQKIANLDIAEVQRGGRPAVVTQNQVALRIQLAGGDVSAFRVEGAAQIAIETKALMLSELDVVKTAKDAILRRFKADISDLEFRLLEDIHLPAIDLAPNDQIRFTVDTPPTAITAGNTRVDVGVLLNGQRRATVTVNVEVLVFRKVAVVQRRMEAGEEIQPDVIRVERRAVGSNDQVLPYP